MTLAAAPITFEKTSADIAALQTEIRSLAAEKGAVILAHNYQRPEVQDVADLTGDSLGLSREAARTDAAVIVFCGVHFMAETAKILSPEKTVLLPDMGAGCSLADSIDADQLRAWKAEHPAAVVVSYVNTTAAVKAESDYCCTSGNAEAVIRAVPADRQILFLPDMHLGAYLERVTGRKLLVWPGECHVHAGIRPAELTDWRRRTSDPAPELLVHPECGCASLVLTACPTDAQVMSTEGMVRHARTSPTRTFVIGTEVGILHRLRKDAPGKEFVALKEDAVCRYMKTITLEGVRDALLFGQHVITVPDEIAARARTAIERMVAIG